jgi:stage V sporulation protein G
MELTEVKVRLVEGDNAEKLRAFATLTFDNEFVVRDVKIIDGTKGLFVAMPSRKVMGRCRQCGTKNPVRAAFCNGCGKKLPPSMPMPEGSPRAHVDIAHPISQECRNSIHESVIAAYEKSVSAHVTG